MSENNTRTGNRDFDGGLRDMGVMGGRGVGGGMGGGETARDFKASWGKLINYCKNYMSVIVIVLIIAAIGTAFQFIVPDKLKDMTNEIVKGLPSLVNGQSILGVIDLNAVFSIGILLVFFCAGAGILSFIENRMMATISTPR